jgi:hypothetical protein
MVTWEAGNKKEDVTMTEHPSRECKYKISKIGNQQTNTDATYSPSSKLI